MWGESHTGGESCGEERNVHIKVNIHIACIECNHIKYIGLRDVRFESSNLAKIETKRGDALVPATQRDLVLLLQLRHDDVDQHLPRRAWCVVSGMVVGMVGGIRKREWESVNGTESSLREDVPSTHAVV